MCYNDKMVVNKWIEHCKQYAKDNSCTYSEAIVKAGATYVKSEPAPRKSKAKKVVEESNDELVKEVKPKKKATKKELLEALVQIESEEEEEDIFVEVIPKKIRKPRVKKENLA